MDASIKRRIIRKVEGLDNEKLLQLYIWLGLDEEDDSKKANLVIQFIFHFYLYLKFEN